MENHEAVRCKGLQKAGGLSEVHWCSRSTCGRRHTSYTESPLAGASADWESMAADLSALRGVSVS